MIAVLRSQSSKVLLGIVFLIMSLASAQTFASEEFCIQDGEAYASHYGIELDEPKKPGWQCDPQNEYYRIVEALKFIGTLAFGKPYPPKPYNQGILGDYLAIDFSSKKLKINPGKSDCRLTVSAFVDPSQKGQLYFCPWAFLGGNEGRTSVLRLAGAIIHEVRHFEKPEHVDCEDGPRACDRDVNYKGAYAAEMELYAKVGTSMRKDVHPALADFARSAAYDTAITKFLRKPEVPNWPFQSTLILQSKSGELLWLRGSEKGRAFSEVEAKKSFLLANQSLFIVPKDGSSPPVLIRKEDYKHPGSATIPSPHPSDFERLFNGLSVKERSEIVDFREVNFRLRGITVAYVAFPKRIMVSMHSYQKNQTTPWQHFIEIPEGNVTSLSIAWVLNREYVAAESAEYVAFASTDTGKMFRIASERDGNTRVHEVKSSLSSYLSVFEASKDTVYLLDHDGQLHSASRDGEVLGPVPTVEDERFDKILFETESLADPKELQGQKTL